ncbi:hypothetical protein DN069_17405 [Streptacidiphilus pinicola]|uniref:Transcription regulator TrmB N-terminal domain-containing protein n=1 Tax=Streptacidiphilus pinicola TaxID=2219663 RepID=A0A2X0IGV0_9ACTN|nr:helix-turn-helix domain-containing protein [Streptacidiphilus pinicola]RAG84272.1 hypothetical protein DN069_17405 [Streptacidiphilus pinicola]
MKMAGSFCEDALEALGLGSYASRAYAALARLPHSTAPQLADESKLPRQRIYDVLDSLVDLKLVVKAPGKPATYRAADPMDASAALLRGHHDRLTQLEAMAADLVTELRPDWLAARAAPKRRLVPDRKAGPQMEHWRDYATHSVLVTACPPFDGLRAPDWVHQVHALTRAGGTVRCVYHADLLNDTHLLNRAAAFAAAGEQARIAPRVPIRMILTDSGRALVALPSHVSDVASGPVLLVDDAHAVQELQTTFDQLWDGAAPLST